ncbi:uncharacterized protein BHQ10_004355 [Talaromyces amestolkiae]|uniref:Amidoligase enzyme n=1 Tax=Talaromyces amestolkiae TaxID=1196081 RepID=A0A364KXQ9_TALAM|nr:uncharacterized protein BHQ10_004355 [Talaromyces amestolkiae]RAO68343.1 hypothetical protein BHQ10_004355 [Talaromyces amestolkiae]
MDDTTGIHIHVSPVNGRWSLVDLKRIAEAIIHFDNPLNTLFPNHNYTQAFLKSNLRDNPILNKLPRGKSPSSVIQETKTVEELIYIMNPPDGRSDFSQRKYAWNFTNNSNDPSVCSNPKYTIEFRSPRSTTACNLIEKWIAFTVTFLHGSVTSPENIHNDFEPTVDGLNGFLYRNRPPGGTDNYCWEKHLSQDAIDKVLNDVDHHTVEE